MKRVHGPTGVIATSHVVQENKLKQKSAFERGISDVALIGKERILGNNSAIHMHAVSTIYRLYIFTFDQSASWSEWSDESPCSVSCGGASQTQRRICVYNGGTSSKCSGSDERTMQCNSQPCREYQNLRFINDRN